MQDALRLTDWEKLTIDPNPSFGIDITDAGCPSCWPISTLTYVLFPLRSGDVSSERVIGFFERAIADGDAPAQAAGYVPLPSKAKWMVRLSMRRWLQLIRHPAGRT